MRDDPSYSDILNAKASGDQALVDQLSLARVWQVISHRSFCTALPWCQDADPEATAAATKELHLAIRRKRLPRIELTGRWDDRPPRAFYFVFEVSLALARTLNERYERPAFLFSGERTENHLLVMKRSGTSEDLGRERSAASLLAAFSRLGDSATFRFDASLPNSWTETLLWGLFRRGKWQVA